MFLLLPSSVYTKPGPLLFSTLSLQPEGWGWTRSWGHTAGTADPKWTKRFSSITLSMESCGEQKEGIRVQRGSICLPKSLLPESCFSGDDWTPDCPYKVVNESLALLCLCIQLLLHLFNCFYLSPWFFSLPPLQFSSPLAWREWVGWGWVVMWGEIRLPLNLPHRQCKALLGLPQQLNRCSERL